MLLPLGLVFAAASFVEEERASLARSQMAFASQNAERYARAKDLWEACTGPSACMLAISGAPLSNLAFDGIPLIDAQPAGAGVAPRNTMGSDDANPYRQGQARLTHAFVAVCPGLHRISAMVHGAEHSTWFTLNPREARSLAFSLDQAGWAFDDSALERTTCEQALQGALYDYNAHVAARRVHNTNSLTSHEALRLSEKWVKAMADAIVKFVPDKAFEVAASARNTLTGVPFGSFSPITDAIGFHAFELQNQGRAADAIRLIDAGLSMLPDAPTLLAVGGELRGATTREGRAMLQQALRREGALAPQLRERVASLAAS
jgi:hypothetical protein